MDSYRVYAIEYAARLADPGDVFLRARETKPIPMNYYVWALVGPTTVVVDTGFTEESARARGRKITRSPAEGLKAVGVDPATVEHVVITHFHWDHLNGIEAFPKATFYAQEREMAFWTGRYARFPIFRDVIEPGDISRVVELGFDGRLVLVDGSREILPGITVHRLGGHTPGMQVVEAKTARGPAVIASDAVKSYRHLAEDAPDAFLNNIPEMLDGYRWVRDRAEDENRIFPGHDPEVLARLKNVGPGIAVLE